MAKKFASKLTDAQFKLARAFECDDRAQIELWKKQLAEWQKVRDAEADELTDNFLPGLAIHLLRVALRQNEK